MKVMKVTMLLADAAQAVGGKLYVLGGGWSVIGPEPTPSAIAVYVQIPWDRANIKHAVKLELLTKDGDAVVLPTPEGEQPLVIPAEIEVGRPAGLAPGTPLDGAFAINIGPLPLEPGRRYEWRLSIDGHCDEDWRLGFSTRAAKPMAAAA